MFQPVSMQRIYLKLLSEDTQPAAQILADFGVLNTEQLEPELIEPSSHHLEQGFQAAFYNARNHLDNILYHLPFTAPKQIYPYKTIAITDLTNIDKQLSVISQQISVLEERQHQLTGQQTDSEQLLATLEKFLNLDIDLGLLHKNKCFLNLHIGIVKASHLQKLTEAAAKAHHFVNVFHRVDETAYCIVAGSLDHANQISMVLNYAEFHPLQLPLEFHNCPKQIHDELTQKLKQLKKELHTVHRQFLQMGEQYQDILAQAYALLHQAAPYAMIADKVRGHGELSVITGWIPREDLIALEGFLAQKLNCPYVLDSRQPLPEERAQVPSLMRQSNFVQMYQSLMQSYGIPRYGEFDPTSLFMVMFLLMFGVIFGDVGQGAVIAGFGWLMRDKLKPFSLFFMIAGIFSVMFGFLYGSVFGIEDTIIPTLWISPLHQPFYILQIALYWGIGFILVMTLLKAMNNWRLGHHTEAIFNNNGLAGIMLYLGGFFSLKMWVETSDFSQLQQFSIILPLSLILAYKWHKNKLPIGEQILVTLVGGLEALINYLTNTLSFLRVAAFSINHIVLAIAIVILANMMGESSLEYWFMAILGNIIIILLEGAIVTIQVLRLEYYEGFSRFFSGNGRLFEPLKTSIKGSA
ncbi:V-type ATPase 116kDa subunit family protein [Candidatus Albibeggiatoa sp. nov. NOAA]|uniref:V-type ATP synthase subunit I n=1 Tax=Candidatus Albibeggiatoa sp. nov. NOAA TaxID=3162724 RepID=UPI0032FA7070|nr:hypothetical protein [Thiotrichaceae bacterium]